MNKSRILGLTDSIISIILTIMVLEIKLPTGTDISWSSLNSIKHVLISYILSYIFIAIYWSNHHHLMSVMNKVNAKIIWVNFIFLFFLSLIPFSTNWIGATSFQKVPAFIHYLNIIFIVISYFALHQIIKKSFNYEEKIKIALKKQESKIVISLILSFMSLIFALFMPFISIIISLIVSTFWIIPDKNIEKVLNED